MAHLPDQLRSAKTAAAVAPVRRPIKEMLKQFQLERVSKDSASLDVKKLFAFQERYFQLLPVEERVTRVLPYLQRTGLVAVWQWGRPTAPTLYG